MLKDQIMHQKAKHRIIDGEDGIKFGSRVVPSFEMSLFGGKEHECKRVVRFGDEIFSFVDEHGHVVNLHYIHATIDNSALTEQEELLFAAARA